MGWVVHVSLLLLWHQLPPGALSPSDASLLPYRTVPTLPPPPLLQVMLLTPEEAAQQANNAAMRFAEDNLDEQSIKML